MAARDARSRVDARLLDTTAELYPHVILAHCGLPNRKTAPKLGFYEKRKGRISIVLTPAG
jgi:hypothetical protein